MHPDFRQVVNLADPLEREWNEGRYRLPLPLPRREGGIEALDWFGETFVGESDIYTRDYVTAT